MQQNYMIEFLIQIVNANILSTVYLSEVCMMRMYCNYVTHSFMAQTLGCMYIIFPFYIASHLQIWN
jgi:hypothetical protein